MKIQSVSSRPRTDGKSGEVSWSTNENAKKLMKISVFKGLWFNSPGLHVEVS